MSEENGRSPDQEFLFDLAEVRSQPVSIPKTNKHEAYSGTLVEAGEAAAAKFHAVWMSSQQGSSDGRVVSIDGEKLAKVRAQLVSDCLDPQPGVAVVNKWPSRMVKKLFQRAKEISDIAEGPQTREDIEAEIEALQKRLARLDDPKGGLGDTVDTSEPPPPPEQLSTSTSSVAE